MTPHYRTNIDAMNPIYHSLAHSKFAQIYLIAVCLLWLACTPEEPGAVASISADLGKSSHNKEEIAAQINGEPILIKEVQSLMRLSDNELNSNQALEILIRSELLAEEAVRRGFGPSLPEVQYAAQIEMTRALLDQQIAKGINGSTLDAQKLEALYNNNRFRFVHGKKRKVSHFLVLTGEQGLEGSLAQSLATDFSTKTTGISSLEEFVQMTKPYTQSHPGKVEVEHLPPFQLEGSSFVEEFVSAAFAIDKIGQTSPAIKTKFGWHVLFWVEEIPALNQSFEEVRDSLAESVLPVEREMKAQEFIDTLVSSKSVFIYDEAQQQESAEK